MAFSPMGDQVNPDEPSFKPFPRAMLFMSYSAPGLFNMA